MWFIAQKNDKKQQWHFPKLKITESKEMKMTNDSTIEKMRNCCRLSSEWKKTATNSRLSWNYVWILAHILQQEATPNKTHRLERVTRLALKLLMEHTAARVNIWPSSGAIDREPHAQPADGGEVHTQWELPHIHSIFLFLSVSHTHTLKRQCSTITKTHYNLWASAFTDSKNEEPDTVIHQ